MPVITSTKDIDEAIDNLNYKSETTLKSRLLRAVRNYYSENSLAGLTYIDTEELVKSIWDTGNDRELIKARRKNLSSIKSAVNSDLKKLYQDGKNRHGIIINHNNIFDISEEAKNKALSGIADIFREKEINAIGKINEILTALNNIVFRNISVQNTAAGAEIDRLKALLDDLAEKLTPAAARGTYPERMIERKEVVEKAADAINIPVKKTADTNTVFSAVTGNSTRADITTILQDKNIDVQSKTEKINALLKEMLAAAISSAGPELDIGDAAKIQSFFEESKGPRAVPLPERKNDGDLYVDADKLAIGTDDEDVLDAAAEFSAEIAESETEETAELGEVAEETDDYSSSEEVEVIGEEAICVSALEPEPAVGWTHTDEELTVATPVAEELALQDGAEPSVDYEEIIVPAETGVAPGDFREESAAIDAAAAEEPPAIDFIDETAEILPEDHARRKPTPGENYAELEEIEIAAEPVSRDDDEVISEADSTEAAEDDLRTKAEIIAELAQAAKALEKIGPDLANSIYSEDEIKEKAKLLAEEFDRYLSVREKFYNQHILIKGGAYLVGGTNRAEYEFPEQRVNLREFYVGKFPVTNALFEIFIEKTGYITTAEKYGFGIVYVPRMQKVKNTLTGTESFVWNRQVQHKRVPGACWYWPTGPGSSLYLKRTHPVVQISLEDACAFAAWTGKRVPTEREWEAAARTARGHLYPWGNSWRDNACNLEKSLRGDTAPVDQYIKFANQDEVADTLGNVLEWTLDLWPEQIPTEETEESYVVKSASWISAGPVKLTDRQPLYKNVSSNILGFRCIAI